jgi:type II secretory pathway pseudopilin PulG
MNIPAGVRSTARGFALLEVLIAAAIGGALLGVLFRFAVSMQTTMVVQGNVADVQQRLRVAVESIRRDLLAAGSGPSRGTAAGPLARIFPPIVPARLGLVAADPELSAYDDRLTILYVPDTHAETILIAGMVDAASAIAIDANGPGCPPARACDFAAGDQAVVFDASGPGGAHDVFTNASVDTGSGTLIPATSLSRAYAAGARVAAIVQRIYHFDRVGKRLMIYDGMCSDVPIVDHVVDLRFSYLADPRPDAIAPPAPGEANCAYAGSPAVSLLNNLGGAAPKSLTDSQLTDGPVCGEAPYRFDADLLRIRRVGVAIRLEVESPELRGIGAVFLSPGLSRGGSKYVPDLQTTVDVAPRNMAGSW